MAQAQPHADRATCLPVQSWLPSSQLRVRAAKVTSACKSPHRHPLKFFWGSLPKRARRRQKSPVPKIPLIAFPKQELKNSPRLPLLHPPWLFPTSLENLRGGGTCCVTPPGKDIAGSVSAAAQSWFNLPLPARTGVPGPGDPEAPRVHRPLHGGIWSAWTQPWELSAFSGAARGPHAEPGAAATVGHCFQRTRERLPKYPCWAGDQTPPFHRLRKTQVSQIRGEKKAFQSGLSLLLPWSPLFGWNNEKLAYHNLIF